MNTVTNVLIGFIAFLHLYFLVLEMFLWDKPKGLKVFGHTLADAQKTALLAKNQGLYNGFLSAGLIWSLIHTSAPVGYELKVFFLSCILVAGLYGGYTVGKKILIVQAIPAALALVLLLI